MMSIPQEASNQTSFEHPAEEENSDAWKDELFPMKLHRILDEAQERGFSHIINWQPDGNSFVIYDKTEMQNKVMPVYFSSAKFKSFQRSLNLWGFQKTRGASAKNGEGGGRFHPCFVRGNFELLKQLRRCRVKEPGSKTWAKKLKAARANELLENDHRFQAHSFGGGQIVSQHLPHGLRGPPPSQVHMSESHDSFSSSIATSARGVQPSSADFGRRGAAAESAFSSGVDREICRSLTQLPVAQQQPAQQPAAGGGRASTTSWTHQTGETRSSTTMNHQMNTNSFLLQAALMLSSSSAANSNSQQQAASPFTTTASSTSSSGHHMGELLEAFKASVAAPARRDPHQEALANCGNMFRQQVASVPHPSTEFDSGNLLLAQLFLQSQKNNSISCSNKNNQVLLDLLRRR